MENNSLFHNKVQSMQTYLDYIHADNICLTLGHFQQQSDALVPVPPVIGRDKVYHGFDGFLGGVVGAQYAPWGSAVLQFAVRRAASHCGAGTTDRSSSSSRWGSFVGEFSKTLSKKTLQYRIHPFLDVNILHITGIECLNYKKIEVLSIPWSSILPRFLEYSWECWLASALTTFYQNPDEPSECTKSFFHCIYQKKLNSNSL